MATLKSRQILAARQAAASSSNIPYEDPPTWKKIVTTHERVVQTKNWVDWVQNPLGISGGILANSLQKIVTGEVLHNIPLEGISLSSGTLSYTKLWRYKLLMKGSNGMEKTQYSPRPQLSSIIQDALPVVLKSRDRDEHNHHTTKTLSQAEKEYPGDEANKIEARRTGSTFVPHYTNYVKEKEAQRETFTPAGINYIKDKLNALENLQRGQKNSIIIINASVSPYQAIILQNRPGELDIHPKSNWVSVQSMGRNVPFMMYTGGEDIISFNISWYANDPENRDEVLWKCKLLESWSKANGYLASPPVLNIKWGNSDIFSMDDKFILESAKYTLKNFQDRAKLNPAGMYEDSNIIDLKLNPACATQYLTFKRVSMDNPTHNDIVPLDKLKPIKGIVDGSLI